MISVIIPVYNCEKYIERCVNSLLCQSFNDFELIIVNDGSTDNTERVCQKLQEKDGRIRLHNKENGGVSSARNFGMENAKGDYISFLDGDDYVPQNYLSVLFEAVKGAEISVCDIACIKNGKETKRFTCKKKTLNTIEAIELLLSRKDINSGPYGKLFSKNVVEGLRFPPMKAYEDILFVLEAFKKANTIACTDKTEYVYDNGTGGAMTGYAKRPTSDVVTMAKAVLEYLDNNKEKFSPLPEYTTLSHLMQHLQALSCENNRSPEQKALIDAIRTFFKENMHRIKRCKLFRFKEIIVYYFASKGYWIKGGIRKI
ncbi:MAG: glycosyltransferase family 2 protein [Ruminococcaceae bacterium]|nr:glycosyltransferase family 2 protein [Oscillospiraceae bacterium]